MPFSPFDPRRLEGKRPRFRLIPVRTLLPNLITLLALCAGLIARRIVCFVREGASVGAGERIGMIRFGSRVDVYLPEGVRPLIAEGQTAIAGETVIADLAARDPQRTFRVG